MGKVYVIGSQKGGCAKTTSTFNLAYSLVKMGKKVLAVDFDSQANLTTCYGIEDTGELEHTIGHLMVARIEDAKMPPLKRYIRTKDGVDFIPSSIYLSVADAKLRVEMGAEKVLAEVLEPLREKYDYILIDTAPALGILTINALAAADEVVITVNPQLLSMMGMQDFLRTVGKIKKRINPKLEVAGILLTMCDARTKLCRVLTEQVTENFQGQIRIFETKIPNTVKVGESLYYSKPIEQYSPKASAGLAYRRFAKELIAYEGWRREERFFMMRWICWALWKWKALRRMVCGCCPLTASVHSGSIPSGYMRGSVWKIWWRASGSMGFWFR